MKGKKNLFDELFPGRVDRVLGILGLGVVPIAGSVMNFNDKAKMALALFLLSTTLWVAVRCLMSLVQLANENTPPEIRVRTNRVSVSLLPAERNDDEEELPLESDHSVCICVWNGGKDAQCTVTLRFPSFLQLSIAEEPALRVDQRSDYYSRTFVLPKGEAHFVTINKMKLPVNMVAQYRDSSRELRIEVAHNGPETVQVVNSVAVAI